MSETQACVLCGITGNLNTVSELLLDIYGPNVEFLFGDKRVCFTCMDILGCMKGMQRHLLSIISDVRGPNRKLLRKPNEWDNLLTNIRHNIQDTDNQFNDTLCDTPDPDTSNSEEDESISCEYSDVRQLHRDDNDVEVARLTSLMRAESHRARGKKRGDRWSRKKLRGSYNHRSKTAMAQSGSQALSQKRSHSAQPQSFSCDSCESTFHYKELLEKHKLTHFLHSCSACGRVFNSPESLQKHQEDHDVWQIQCKYCTMRFTCHKILSHIKKHIDKQDRPLVSAQDNKEYYNLVMLQKPTGLA